jgi:hypothetical protein
MSDLGKYVPLKTVVAYALDELGLSYDKFDSCWILGLRALVEMNFDISAEPKTIRIPLNGNKTANIPSDCLSWTKIGVLDKGGKISTLKINNGLTTWMDTNPNRVSKLQQSQVNDNVGALAAAPLYLNFYQNGTYSNYFGTGNGLIQHGECRVDDKNQVIIFPPDFSFDSVLFEYISSPEKDDDYMVELALQEAIIAFIKWKKKLGDRAEYYAAMTSGRRRLSKKRVTLQQIAQVIRQDGGMKLQS